VSIHTNIPSDPLVARLGRTVALSLMMLLSGWAPMSHAATVLPMDASTLADLAGHVVAGTVVSTDPHWADNPRRIETTITLQDVEYLKGGPSAVSGAFSFVVPGGTVAGTRMHIVGAPTFHVGERWVLFLLPTYKIFPVVGIHRGCFRVQQEPDGTDRIYDVSHNPILGLDGNKRIIAPAAATSPASRRLVREAGVRLRTNNAARNVQRAIRYEAFRDILRPILDQSKNYHLTRSAGRPVPHRWTVTTLKAAGDGTDAIPLAVNRRSVLRSFGTPKRADARARAYRRH